MAGPNPTEQPKMYCPKCYKEFDDFDGVGVVKCDVCDYCGHVSLTGNICDACGIALHTSSLPTTGKPLVIDSAQPDKAGSADIVFNGQAIEWIRLEPDGKIFIRGELVDNNHQVCMQRGRTGCELQGSSSQRVRSTNADRLLLKRSGAQNNRT